VLDVAAGTHRFETIFTNRATVHYLLVTVTPDRLVIEACSVARWVDDLAIALSIPTQVANTNGEAWRYKRVKRKTDRSDARNETHRVVAS
jgi:transposase